MTMMNFDELPPASSPSTPDFSGPAAGAAFTADGETFQLVSELAGMAHLEITDNFSQLAELIRNEPRQAIDQLIRMIRMLMLQTSAERFIERLRGTDKPISLTRAVNIIKWSVEQVTGRPTQPDEPSSSG